ncbi:SLATT domain-containing protein [Alloscardovia macacae]|uniref:SMODS and SLOG-associating 2TM effector domain-containing protein n=1 Tax=Alloscardovia macacae TaxID=1160091 RepID=A0A261F259_9BIFI|nr:SLATT domain-containing protein [Alloscardovia macacae]OZG53210.1 hypothetical protein ALMA_1512 [Alloscardovia macacae]
MKYQILLDEVRQNFASVVWTHKIQEKQADLYEWQYKCVMTINIVLASITSAGILTVIFNDGFALRLFSALVSLGSLGTTAVLGSFDLKAMSERNKNTANRLVILRNQLIHVIEKLHGEGDIEEINQEYENIMSEVHRVYADAPSTTSKAERKASKALKDNNEYTYTQEEIDRFLPPSLRGEIHNV